MNMSMHVLLLSCTQILSRVLQLYTVYKYVDDDNYDISYMGPTYDCHVLSRDSCTTIKLGMTQIIF